MDVNHVVAKTKEQSHHLDTRTRIVDAVGIDSLVSGEIHDGARHATSSHEIPQRDDVRLHAAPWRRIRTEE
jgi:hypothetical protein